MSGRLSVVVVVAILAGLPEFGVAAGDLSTLVAPYLAAQKEKAVGAIAGHAYAESPRRQAPPTPYPSVQVRLLPYSAQFEAQLDAIKSGLRDSLKNYGEAVTRFEDARIAYERALLEAGGGALVRDGVTDAGGTVRLTEVPTGDWLLVAWWETGHQRKTNKPDRRGVDQYADVPMTVDYSTVTCWRRRVSVKLGEETEVTLSDRAVWMTAVRQEVLSTSSGNPRNWGQSPLFPTGSGTPGSGTPLPPGGGLSGPR
jgi:hypothetical protein